MNKKIILPKFKNEDEERKYWDKIDLSEYIESGDMVPVSFPNLRPTTQPISIRLPLSLLNRIKEKANSMAVPYQALMKQWLQAAAYS